MMRRAAVLLALCLAAGRGLGAQADSGARATLLVRAGRLLAVRTGTMLNNQAILIEGDRIKEVGPADAVAGHAPRDVRVIDLHSATVLPGLIDCHTHITGDPGDYYKQLFRMSPIDEAVGAHIFAKRTLDARFTTVRNVGAAEFIDVALRNAINEGVVAGPRENFKKAVQAGVKIAFGTDAGVYPHGWNAKQFAHMVRWGTTPIQAIQAATVNAADLLGWSDRVGALEPGKYADVIAVQGDPLQDVTVLEHVGFVMKGGQVVKDSLTGGAKAAR